MIVANIEEGNVTLVMGAVAAGVLLKYLDIPRKPIELAMITKALESNGVYAPERNVESHLESIRVTLDDFEADIFPHLMDMDCDCPVCSDEPPATKLDKPVYDA